MSVFVPTGADVAVDPLDVLLVAPNGSTSTTLYLAQGQPVVIAAMPAAVVAELNAAAGLVGPDTLFTTPVTASEWPSPIYIAGAQVKRVQSSGATQLGSMVMFALSGFMVTVPDVNLSDMVDLINATSAGGGVNPASLPSVQSWVPANILVFGCTLLSPGVWEATRIPSNDPENELPYWLVSCGSMSVQVLTGDIPRLSVFGFQSVLSAPMSSGDGAIGVAVQTRNGENLIDGGVPFTASASTDDSLTLTAGDVAWTDDETLQFSITLMYRQAGE